jgi:hypothetical protein
MVKDIPFVDHTYSKRSGSITPKQNTPVRRNTKSPAVRAMERVGAAEVLLVCESVRAISTLSAVFSRKITCKLYSIEKDARETLTS